MSSNLVRYGGLSAIVASVMYVLVAILSLTAPQAAMFDSFTDYLIETIFVAALAGTLVAIAGLHTFHGRRYGKLGAMGAMPAFAGYTLMLVAAAATTRAGHETLDAVFPLGVLAALVGSALFGTALLRARIWPWWCGVLLIAGFPLSVGLDVAVSGAGSSMLGIA